MPRRKPHPWKPEPEPEPEPTPVPEPEPAPSPAPTPAPESEPEPTGLKSPMRGLLTFPPPPEAYKATINGYVPWVYWKDLQPTKGGPIVTGPIDTILSRYRGMGLTGGLKLRIGCGRWSPPWALALGGGPIAYTDAYDGITAQVPKWWTAEFGAAYVEFHTKLAAIYDGLAEIREVTITRAMAIWAEPFIRSAGANASTLLATGFTDVADMAAHRAQIDAHRVWQRTRSGLACNPYQHIRADGTHFADTNFTIEMMRYARSVLGKRAVIENNSIRTPTLAGAYPPMYAEMKAIGPPTLYQCAAPHRVGDLAATLQWAVDQGANAVELNGNVYQTALSSWQLQSFDKALEGNTT